MVIARILIEGEIFSNLPNIYECPKSWVPFSRNLLFVCLFVNDISLQQLMICLNSEKETTMRERKREREKWRSWGRVLYQIYTMCPIATKFSGGKIVSCQTYFAMSKVKMCLYLFVNIIDCKVVVFLNIIHLCIGGPRSWDSSSLWGETR